MDNAALLIAVFMTGLMGATHCVGMCGGIVGMLTTGMDPQSRDRPWRAAGLHLSYNLGRLSSYIIAGLLVGLLGRAILSQMPVSWLQSATRYLSGAFLLLIGLYLLGRSSPMHLIERLGAGVWKLLQPLTRHVLPVRHPGQALALGMLWGWLPCGMVYWALLGAALSGSALQGGLVMLAFGIATLPAMLLTGLISHHAGGWVQMAYLRKAAGVISVGLGLLILLAGDRLFPALSNMVCNIPE